NLWAEISTDPVLRWLSRQFVRRQLPKEVYCSSNEIPEEIRSSARDAVGDAIRRLGPKADLPSLNRHQAEEALDYFVLGDRCPFEEDVRLEGLLFDTGGKIPLSLKDLGDDAAREIGHGAKGFTIVRLYVLENFEDAVRNALEKRKQ